MNLATAFRQAPAHLRLLVVMRAVAIVVMAAVYVCFDCFLDVRVPLAVGGILGFYGLVDFATLLRLRQPAPIGGLEMFGQLLVDVVLLTALLYLTGGARNPLALYYLLLVLYSSTALPPRLVWAFAGVCVVGYVALFHFHVSLPLPESIATDRQLDYFTRVLLYAFVAVLIAWFGIRLSAVQRLQHEQRRADTEKSARERYLVGLAALSAGTAHELSTPLSTMSVVIGDLRESDAPPSEWKESIDMLWTQIQLCRRSLAELAGAAGVESLGQLRSVRASELVAQVAARLRSLRPGLALKLGIELEDDLAVQSDHTLPQALMNFLNNAADASPSTVELRAAQDALNPLKLVIEVLDRGPGIPDELRQRLGKDIITTKAAGHGAGILIAQAAIERLGGAVALSERRSGGTCVRVELPGFRPGGETRGAVMR
ncbi:MAG TPA: ATP-binding protein [Burkholderiales bacterium]|jgi:two-component system sensor histidine kinase RegB